jgi:hypothetical protein
MKQGEAYQITITALASLMSTTNTSPSSPTMSPSPTTPLVWSEDSSDPQTVVPSEYHDFLDVFDKEVADKLPARRKYDHEIPIDEGKEIPHTKIFPLSTDELATLRDSIDNNLKHQFIVPSTSPVGTPILFVKKKDGSLRLCVNYHSLNSVTIKNKYALPLVGEALNRLSKAKYYTQLDLRNGYHVHIAARIVGKCLSH